MSIRSARSSKKPPYVEASLFYKLQKALESKSKAPVRTYSRRSTILPTWVGLNIEIHNGKNFLPLYITEGMIGHKLGEFSPTRVFKKHSAMKKEVQRGPQK